MSPVRHDSDGAVVIGGVGEGLGFALSARFARAGHPVVMLARTQDKVDRFADAIRAEGGVATGLATDVRDEAKMIAEAVLSAGEVRRPKNWSGFVLRRIIARRTRRQFGA